SGPVNTARSPGPYLPASGAVASVTSPLGPVLFRLTDTYGLEKVPGKVRVQTIEEDRSEVFGRRDHAAEPVDVHVEVAVIDVVDDQLAHQRRELAQVVHVTRL